MTNRNKQNQQTKQNRKKKRIHARVVSGALRDWTTVVWTPAASSILSGFWFDLLVNMCLIAQTECPGFAIQHMTHTHTDEPFSKRRRGKFKSKTQYHILSSRSSSSLHGNYRAAWRWEEPPGRALLVPVAVDVFYIWHHKLNVPLICVLCVLQPLFSWFKATYICDDFNKTFS